MSADFDAATISAVAPVLRRKELSPVDLANHYLQRIKHLNPLLNAYIE